MGASCRDRDGRTDVYLAYRIRQGCLPRSLDLGNLAAAAVSAVGRPETVCPLFFFLFSLLVNLDLEAMHVSLRFWEVAPARAPFPAGRDAFVGLAILHPGNMHSDNCVR